MLNVLLLVAMLAGCQSSERTPALPVQGQLIELRADSDVRVQSRPPPGWQPRPLEHFPRSVQRVWVSPTGRTAYGVIHIRLPFPVGPNLVLWRFIADMRRLEGGGRLISRERSGDEIHFIAENPRYRFNARLCTSGLNAWVIYAGVTRDQPVDPAEFGMAEFARDATVVGGVAADR